MDTVDMNQDTRSLRTPGWLGEPGVLRSLDVCLDSKGPFIDVFSDLVITGTPAEAGVATARMQSFA